MTTTTDAAARRMRASNPVPPDAFGGAAGDRLGRAAFETIIASPPARSPAAGGAGGRPGRIRAGAGARPPAGTGPRLGWRLTGPAIAAAATLATVLIINGTGAPHEPRSAPTGLISPGGDRTYQLAAFFRRLDAVFRAHPATVHGDAAAVLRQLASRAAVQPTPRLGPVMYSARRLWEYVGGNTPRNLNYFSRHYYYEQAWNAADGASADNITEYLNGKVRVLTSSYPPPSSWDPQVTNWARPATLPTAPAALRQYLLDAPYKPAALRYLRFVTLPATHKPPARSQAIDYWTDGTITYATWPPGHPPRGDVGAPGYVHNLNGPRTIIYTEAIGLMISEPLPPAMRASLLQLVADVAARPGAGRRWVNLGTMTDRLGRTGVAVAAEQGNFNGPHTLELNVMIFDPKTGALLDDSNAGCAINMGTIPTARGECVPYDYTEVIAIKAAPRVPPYPDHDPKLYAQANGPFFPF